MSSGIKNIHTVEQPSPPSISRTVPSSQTETLSPLTTNTPHTPPAAPGTQHPAFCLYYQSLLLGQPRPASPPPSCPLTADTRSAEPRPGPRYPVDLGQMINGGCFKPLNWGHLFCGVIAIGAPQDCGLRLCDPTGAKDFSVGVELGFPVGSVTGAPPTHTHCQPPELRGTFPSAVLSERCLRGGLDSWEVWSGRKPSVLS